MSSSRPDSEESVGQFEHDAETAGIAPPPRRKFGRSDLVITLAVTALIIGACFEIGHVTGWLNPSRSTTTGPLLATDCTPGSPDSSLVLGVEPNASTTLSPTLEAIARTFTNQTGPCLSVGSSSAGFGSLTTYQVASLVGPETPLTGGLGPLANETFTVPLLGSPLVVFYNLGSDARPLNLTATALTGAYLGTLTNWSDPRVVDANPGFSSPLRVSPFSYSGSSAANELLSDYLSDWNSSFRSTVGASWSGPWPAGAAVASPQAMLSAVTSTPGGLGYETANVCPDLPHNVTCALVESANGSFVAPAVPAILAAVNLSANSSGALTGNWSSVSGVSLGNPAVYPMVELTYAFVYHDLGTTYGPRMTLTEATWLLTMLWWVETFETSGYQANSFGPLVGEFGYVPLPSSVAGKAQTTLSEVAYNGTSVLFPYGGEENGEGGNDTTGEF